jgi:hypothetical protein
VSLVTQSAHLYRSDGNLALRNGRHLLRGNINRGETAAHQLGRSLCRHDDELECVDIAGTLNHKLSNHQKLAVRERTRNECSDHCIRLTMDNAWKYCRKTIAVRATPWTAAGWRRPGLVLDVEDDGRGIPPAERTRVLERGARADESVSGQGIGLSVAREIAAAYSGTLEIGDSRLGGARVSLRLPGR